MPPSLNVAYCSITSPIDGITGLRLVDVGNLVQTSAATPLVVVTEIKPI
jgi:membrane fusion protein, multidrug efflux system